MVRFETQRVGGAEGSTVMLRSKLACHWPTSRTNDLIQCHKLSVSPLLLHSSAFQDFTLVEWFVLKRRGKEEQREVQVMLRSEFAHAAGVGEGH